MSDMRRILIVRTDRLGETLLTLPLSAAIKQAAPTAHVSWMVGPVMRDLMVGAPGVDEVFVWDTDDRTPWWRLASRAARLWKPLHLDAVLIANPKKEFHLASWLAGVPRRIGWDRKWAWALTDRLADRKAAGGRHELEWNLELLRPLHVDPSPARRFRLPVAPDAAVAVASRLRAAGVRDNDVLIAVHCSTSNPKKQWPVERFAELARQLTSVACVVLVGEPGNEEQPVVWPETTINWIGKTTLSELAAVLARSRVLVSCDSGPVHLAAAVGTRVITLFGTEDSGSRPERWRPWGPGHVVIRQPLDRITVADVCTAVRL